MINQLVLLNFKKHQNKTIKFEKKIILLNGKNGSGKTSILEAISLFTAGKGIFNLNNEKLINNKQNYFQIDLSTDISIFNIKFHIKKEIFINNLISKSSNILENISILGLTPYTSLAFWQDSQLRRKIIDRIILQHNKSYANFYKEYLKALKQRNLLIANNTFNQKWKEILDTKIKENGLKINNIRKMVLTEIIQNTSIEIKKFLNDDMHIEIYPSYEQQEKILSEDLALNFIGPHLSKFILGNKKKEILSTGQERKLLISFLLASLTNDGKENILLLDDVLSNLDKETIQNLLKLLNTQNIQTFITHIEPIENNNIECIKIE